MGRLVLGTVQFGLPYGVNSQGRPSEAAVREILSFANEAGITTLDTSSAYGNAEEVLGRCMPAGSFRVVSKYPKGEVPVREMFGSTLSRLGTERLYGYLLHHFSLFKERPSIWDEMLSLKEDGKVERIGFSIYSTEELDLIIDSGVHFDLIQFPYNILDRQFEPYLADLRRRGVEIHVRSTFLQGLFFMDRNALPGKLQPLKKYLLELDRCSQESGMSIAALALNYNLQNPLIDGVLVGVDNVRQLEANVSGIRELPFYPRIDVREKELLNPVNWN